MPSNVVRRGVLAAGTAGLVGLVGYRLLPHEVGAAVLTQSQIETQAVALVQARLGYSRLIGPPTRVLSKPTTLGAFRAQFDPYSRDPRSADTPVWMVVLDGDLDVSGPPTTTGTPRKRITGRMFVLLGGQGEPVAWGGVPADFDLNAPPTPPPWAKPLSPEERARLMAVQRTGPPAQVPPGTADQPARPAPDRGPAPTPTPRK